MSCFQSIEDRKTMLWATISNHYFYFQILWQTLVSNISKPNINNVMSYIPDKYLSCMHDKWGFVMHAWQRRVCHACMTKEGLSDGLPCMHGKVGFVRGCVIHAWPRVYHCMLAWQWRICHACMAKDGLLYMYGNGGFAMHAWHGGFVMHAWQKGMVKENVYCIISNKVGFVIHAYRQTMSAYGAYVNLWDQALYQ